MVSVSELVACLIPARGKLSGGNFSLPPLMHWKKVARRSERKFCQYSYKIDRKHLRRCSDRREKKTIKQTDRIFVYHLNPLCYLKFFSNNEPSLRRKNNVLYIEQIGRWSLSVKSRNGDKIGLNFRRFCIPFVQVKEQNLWTKLR